MVSKKRKTTLDVQDPPENRNLVSLLVQNSDIEKKSGESERYLREVGVIKKNTGSHTYSFHFSQDDQLEVPSHVVLLVPEVSLGRGRRDPRHDSLAEEDSS